jgi:NAD(P)-dependent dehydrogenase (short-subunit alcohol dehydrogenase family)
MVELTLASLPRERFDERRTLHLTSRVAGLIDTDIHAASGDPDRARKLGAATPLGRAGKPEEVAEAIVWLLSEAASYVTGAILDVAGGR